MARRLVEVIIPVYKEELAPEERLSFARCSKVLGNYPITLVAPQRMALGEYAETQIRFSVKRFPPDYFKSISGYNRLLMYRQFYKSCIDSEYILIYQLDSYVFRDELEAWCRRGFDYLGAPWFQGHGDDNGNGF